MHQQHPRQDRPSLCFLGAALLVMAFNAWYYVDFQTRSVGMHRMRSVDAVEDDRSPVSSAGDGIEIALLLSFPNSGTSYTMLNVEQMTNTTGGTNYDGEVPSDECCPMVVNVSPSNSHVMPKALGEAAPFIHYPQKRLPRVVLTKTHCKSDSTTFDAFTEGCYSVVFNSKGPGNVTSVPYSRDVRVTRYVHLIRSPVDNLVARKHMAVRRSVKMGTLLDPLKAEVLMNDTAETFQLWCRALDKRHLPSMVFHRNHTHALHDWLADVAQSPGYIPIPCVSDLYWYVSWHNYAAQLTLNQADVLVLYYEDYATKYNDTIASLLSFLELPLVASPVAFDSSKSYADFFTEDQRDAIHDFVHRFSTEDAWNLLQRYFV